MENYQGWGNFDGLSSKVFRKTPFYKSSFFRLVWTQFFKRSPVNFRRLALVPKNYNTKGLGLFASGLILRDDYEEAEFLLNILKKLVCSEYSGMSWGYDFDWQTRSGYTPAGVPTIVATVFVANAFLDYFNKTKGVAYLEVAKKASEFIIENLVLFENNRTLCFGYYPGNKVRVHNANMLGASFLARVYQITRDPIYFEKSQKAMTYSIQALNPDFSWVYGDSKYQKFIDNFHTGFNLVALLGWMKYTNETCWGETLKKAYNYFLSTFWLNNGCPKYYHNSLYPIDIHCSAQGIVTCLKLSEYHGKSLPFAFKIAKWAIDNMLDSKGFFYYQKTRFFTNKIPYIRWSQAWMFYALSLLEKVYLNKHAPT